MHTITKMGLKVKASGKSKIHHGLELFSDFWLQGAFLHMYSVSLVPKEEEGEIPQSFTPTRVFASVLALIIPLTG